MITPPAADYHNQPIFRPAYLFPALLTFFVSRCAVSIEKLYQGFRFSFPPTAYHSFVHPSTFCTSPSAEMRACTILALVGLGSLTFAQSINLTYVDAHTVATPTLILYQKQQIVEYNQATAISAVIAAVSATPIADPGEQGLDTREPLHKRDSPVAVVMRVLVPACQALNGTLYDVPVNGTVADPVAKFLKDMVLQEQAISAITPHGYTQVFQNIKNSSQANGYMG